MLRFLSTEWVAEVNRAILGIPEPGEDGPERGWTIQWTLAGGPEGTFNYVVRVDRTGVTMELGEVQDPDVILRQEYRTASLIAQGALTIPDALAAGLVRVRGDLGTLSAAGEILAQAAARLGDLGSRTTFPG